MCVCVCACVRACVCVLPMAVVPSFSGSVAICYVLPVLLMTSYFAHILGCVTSIDTSATSDVIASGCAEYGAAAASYRERKCAENYSK